MTREEILSMSAGRELDKLVAEKVMELDPIWNIPNEDYVYTIYLNDSKTINTYGTLPHYSIAISSAWEVLDKFDGWQITKFQYEDGGYQISCAKHMYTIRTNSVPEGVCKAALLAVMEE